MHHCICIVLSSVFCRFNIVFILFSVCVFGGYVLICFSLALSDNPSQVSRVLVAIETLDLNDNAPELDRQYNTAMCDSSSIGQVSMCLNYLRSLFPFHSSVYKMFILKTWKDTKTHVKETSPGYSWNYILALHISQFRYLDCQQC